jgi:hypothetical protein
MGCEILAERHDDLMLLVYLSLRDSHNAAATKAMQAKKPLSSPAQATPDFLPAPRNKRHALLFPDAAGLSVMEWISHGRLHPERPFSASAAYRRPRVKRVRLETKVRLDDDLRRGAFGLTADNSVKKPKTAGKGKAGSKSGLRGSDPHVANALRTAYDEAVREDVPAEFLDLLGKLS